MTVEERIRDLQLGLRQAEEQIRIWTEKRFRFLGALEVMEAVRVSGNGKAADGPAAVSDVGDGPPEVGGDGAGN